jgi:hypothetical protein
MKKYNQTVILALGALLISLFVYLTPPGNLASQITSWSLFDKLPGDTAQYISRFALSLLLFGVVPLLYIRLSGLQLTSIGLNGIRGDFFRSRLFPLLLLICLTVGVTSAFDPQLAAYYPYSRTLTSMAVEKSPLYFLLHASSYILFYYIPWEIFFRGFLILPLLTNGELEKNDITPRMLMIASFQIIPSSLVHFGHPLSETIGAIPFGILCGWLVLRYRSIVPGLLLHAITGVTMDLIITIRSAL